MPIKLAIVVTDPISLGFFTVQQIAVLKAKGFEVFAISAAGDNLLEFGRLNGIPVYSATLVRQVSPLKDIKALFELYKLFCQLNPDIVHGSTPKAGLLSMLAALLARVPVRFYTMHGIMSEISSGLFSYILLALEWITCQCAHKVLAVSESVRSIAIRRGICKQTKISILGKGSCNGVNSLDIFNPIDLDVEKVRLSRLETMIPVKSNVVGFVGRLACDKGICDLAIAWSIVSQDCPDAYLLIIGQKESRDTVPVEILSLLSSFSSVKILGEITNHEMPYYYANMDLVTLPTYREGFPKVILEASAMALPVVATKVTGCVDAVVDGITGTLVPAKNPEVLAGAIVQYLNDPELRKQHGKAGRALVLRDFRPENICKELYGEYVRLLQEKGIAFDALIR